MKHETDEMADIELIYDVQLLLLHGLKLFISVTMLQVNQLQKITFDQLIFNLAFMKVEIHLRSLRPVVGDEQKYSEVPRDGPREVPHHDKYIEISHYSVLSKTISII